MVPEPEADVASLDDVKSFGCPRSQFGIYQFKLDGNAAVKKNNIDGVLTFTNGLEGLDKDQFTVIFVKSRYRQGSLNSLKKE